MIIPIGLEQDTVRRLPWVTFGLMAACLLALLATNAMDSSGQVESSMYEAEDYFYDHPYLEIGDELYVYLFQGMTEDAAAAAREAFRESVERPDSNELIAQQQAELDRLVAQAFEARDSHPYYTFGLIPSKFSLLALFAHMFMHAGWLHLIGNMLMLYLAGPFIEDVWGRPLYLGFYVASGLAASGLHVLFYPGSEVPLVGASGAIAGVMGAFVIRYWNTKIHFFYIFGFFLRGTFWAPAWLMLGLWLGEQVFMALMVDGIGAGSGGGVAYWAHVGGFVFGALFALAVRHGQVEERYVNESIESKVKKTVVNNESIERAMKFHTSGRSENAYKMLVNQLLHDPTNGDVALAVWQVALDCGWPSHAAPALVCVVREELRKGHDDLALDHWKEMLERVPDAKADPKLRIRIAQLRLEKAEVQPALAEINVALSEAQSNGTLTAPFALKCATMAAEHDQGLAAHAATVARTCTDAGPNELAQSDALLQDLRRPAPVVS